jgi:probable selenium-dependent hydroxylase accessory protein YqeC
VEAFHLEGFKGLIALVGAGGKTGLMFRIAREISAMGGTVITATTTNIRPPAPDQSPALILTSEDPELASLPDRVKSFGHVTIGHAIGAAGKVSGVDESALLRCVAAARITVVEADGAAGRSIKAPEPWEPVIPSFSALVIPVAGLDCMGRPASPDRVFRLDRFLEVAGIREGDPITPQVAAEVILSPRGGMKGVPPRATVIPYLNKSDLCDPQVLDELAGEILRRGRPRVRRVVAGSLLSGFTAQVYC